MKDKALEKLSKNELLELMLYLRKEYDKLNAENEKLLQKLEDKKSITDRLDRLERQADGQRRFLIYVQKSGLITTARLFYYLSKLGLKA